MAAPRKRNASSFSPSVEPKVEEEKIEEFLEEVAAEMFETISLIEKEHEPEEPAPPATISTPVTFQSITPVEDEGPRFIDTPPKQVEEVKKPSEPLTHPPKRHPRNIPRFSRHRKP